MSNFPSRTDLINAMRNPQVSYKSDDLIGGSVIQKGSRVIQYAGGYTTVFPFNKKDGSKVAIRLWIANIGDAKKRSQEISKYLNDLKSEYFVEFKYIEDAILVNGTLHPTVIMDWVDGLTLKEYINSNISDAKTILDLADKFKNMVQYFHSMNIAHGDLQHGNILVKNDGNLIVIDYDSMYIEPLNGMSDIIKGLQGYQHPSRNQNKFLNKKLDYFSELVIYLSLLIYAENPELWKEYYETEDLLFSKDDFLIPSNSELILKGLNSKNTKISDLTKKLLTQLEIDDILQLSPLEILLVNKKEVAKKNIIDKWEHQPNPPIKKTAKLPNKNKITDKF